MSNRRTIAAIFLIVFPFIVLFILNENVYYENPERTFRMSFMDMAQHFLLPSAIFWFLMATTALGQFMVFRSFLQEWKKPKQN